VAEVNNHELEVWIDVSFIEKKPIKIGHLKHDRGNVRFNYDEAWLSHPQRFDIDPDLSLDNAIFHPNPAQGNFGVFLDSSPDRWGQTLMKRREAMEAKDEGRQARTLYAWDYLIGVQDQTRQGALRFKYPGTDVFLASHDLSAPPVAQLAELENVAKQLSDKNIDDLDNLKQDQKPTLLNRMDRFGLLNSQRKMMTEIVGLGRCWLTSLQYVPIFKCRKQSCLSWEANIEPLPLSDLIALTASGFIMHRL